MKSFLCRESLPIADASRKLNRAEFCEDSPLLVAFSASWTARQRRCQARDAPCNSVVQETVQVRQWGFYTINACSVKIKNKNNHLNYFFILSAQIQSNALTKMSSVCKKQLTVLQLWQYMGGGKHCLKSLIGLIQSRDLTTSLPESHLKPSPFLEQKDLLQTMYLKNRTFPTKSFWPIPT